MSQFRIGVCSWSLLASSPDELLTRVESTGIEGVQLALDPIRREEGQWSAVATSNVFKASSVSIVSGMMAMEGEDYSTLDSIRKTGGVRLDAHWQANLRAARENARLAQTLGIPLVTFHAGFIPEQPGDEERLLMVDRLQEVIDAFESCDVRVAFETGQETAETLLSVLAELERPNVGVNFDPANMILYGKGDPVAALQRLRSHIVQIHIKDARPTSSPGTWGTEVPAGSGSVDWPAFFEAVNEFEKPLDLVIERESGDDRLGDIIRARRLIERHWGAS